MRAFQRGDVLHVRAIGGLHVVTLAWDFADGREDKRSALLGFAIERSELSGGEVIERYFLRGIKRFKDKDEGLAPGTPVSTAEHPIQSFQWGDYTAKPATAYRYRVVPLYGQPKLIESDDASATTVEIQTEAEAAGSGTGARHDVFFNRGAAGSQAYSRKFGSSKPDEHDPGSEPMRWLSRGLFEALTAFIARANAAEYGLRAVFYEFRYLPVLKAFADAARLGADVAIRYEAQTYLEENEKTIAQAKIKRLCKPLKVRGGIRHNKFIVLLHHDQPVAVWTGSTNISAGGIFGHSNVGHAIWDADVARRYLAYWERLADPDVVTSHLREANLEAEPTPAAGSEPPADRMLTLFSPRDTKDDPITLEWYAGLVGEPRGIVCQTFAFSLDPAFQSALLTRDDTIRYAVFDKSPGKGFEEDVSVRANAVIAVGAKLGKGDMEHFLGEHLTGFNKNLYIHDKFVLLDPLGSAPIVITGSANFSRGSQNANDENMLVIRGQTRVADIYFGEFMRIFDHLYSRYLVKRLSVGKQGKPADGHLKERAEDWVPAHFAEGGRKSLRRRRFMGF